MDKIYSPILHVREKLFWRVYFLLRMLEVENLKCCYHKSFLYLKEFALEKSYLFFFDSCLTDNSQYYGHSDEILSRYAIKSGLTLGNDKTSING